MLTVIRKEMTLFTKLHFLVRQSVSISDMLQRGTSCHDQLMQTSTSHQSLTRKFTSVPTDLSYTFIL